MSQQVNISSQEWELLKLKFQRKYNHLSEADLEFVPGQENALIQRLAMRVRRDEAYILFTLKKELVDLASNRL